MKIILLLIMISIISAADYGFDLIITDKINDKAQVRYDVESVLREMNTPMKSIAIKEGKDKNGKIELKYEITASSIVDLVVFKGKMDAYLKTEYSVAERSDK